MSSSDAPLPADGPQRSSLLPFLRSNVLPPELSSNVYRSTLATDAHRLELYNRRIAAFEADLGALKRERDALEKEVLARRSVFAPIRRLPPELLSEVFELCAPPAPVRRQGVPEQGSPEVEVERLRKPHLLTLAQVSCHWRRIAMGTPKLWSNIAVETAMWPRCSLPPESLLELVRAALIRSAGHPLCIRVITEQDDPNAPPVFGLLVQNAHRWREADIRIDRAAVHLLEPVRGKLPLLEKLGLHTRGEQLSMFSEAPRLKEMIFWGYSTCRLDIPWANVDVFRACGGPMETRTSLSFMSFLPEGSSAYFYINAQRMPPPGVDLPHITSVVRRFGVDIGCCFDPDVGMHAVERLWDSLTFKNLYHLHLKARRTHPAPLWHHPSFLALIHRSGFATGLVSLTLRTQITEPQLLDVLAPLGALEKLDLTDIILHDRRVVITDALLRRLTFMPKRRETHILPSLQRLYLRSLLGFSEAVFISFVRSRTPSVSTSEDSDSEDDEAEAESEFSVAWLTFVAIHWVPKSAVPGGDDGVSAGLKRTMETVQGLRFREGPLQKADYS
ncbi:hypothetical protein C8F01DRAFT_1230303 [Mycena amicta]|nr:hypothetical protein C8F01DRAFT_1230303 [Mycena amicta]